MATRRSTRRSNSDLFRRYSPPGSSSDGFNRAIRTLGDRFRQAGELLGVNLLDFLIVNNRPTGSDTTASKNRGCSDTGRDLRPCLDPTAADVGMVILYHQLHFGGESAEEMVEEVRSTYDGKVVYGRDLDVF